MNLVKNWLLQELQERELCVNGIVDTPLTDVVRDSTSMYNKMLSMATSLYAPPGANGGGRNEDVSCGCSYAMHALVCPGSCSY